MKKTISGLNIYQDEKGRNILYNKRTQTGYLIQEKDYKAYQLYSNRYVILVILFILFSNFITSWQYILGILLILGIGFEYAYRKKFLPSLTTFSNMKPFKKVSPIDSLVETGNKQRCLVLGLAYLALSILIIVNGLSTNANLVIMIGNIVISIGSLYFAVINLIAFSKIK